MLICLYYPQTLARKTPMSLYKDKVAAVNKENAWLLDGKTCMCF